MAAIYNQQQSKLTDTLPAIEDDLAHVVRRLQEISQKREHLKFNPELLDAEEKLVVREYAQKRSLHAEAEEGITTLLRTKHLRLRTSSPCTVLIVGSEADNETIKKIEPGNVTQDDYSGTIQNIRFERLDPSLFSKGITKELGAQIDRSDLVVLCSATIETENQPNTTDRIYSLISDRAFKRSGSASLANIVKLPHSASTNNAEMESAIHPVQRDLQSMILRLREAHDHIDCKIGELDPTIVSNQIWRATSRPFAWKLQYWAKTLLENTIKTLKEESAPPKPGELSTKECFLFQTLGNMDGVTMHARRAATEANLPIAHALPNAAMALNLGTMYFIEGSKRYGEFVEAMLSICSWSGAVIFLSENSRHVVDSPDMIDFIHARYILKTVEPQMRESAAIVRQASAGSHHSEAEKNFHTEVFKKCFKALIHAGELAWFPIEKKRLLRSGRAVHKSLDASIVRAMGNDRGIESSFNDLSAYTPHNKEVIALLELQKSDPDTWKKIPRQRLERVVKQQVAEAVSALSEFEHEYLDLLKLGYSIFPSDLKPPVGCERFNGRQGMQDIISVARWSAEYEPLSLLEALLGSSNRFIYLNHRNDWRSVIDRERATRSRQILAHWIKRVSGKSPYKNPKKIFVVRLPTAGVAGVFSRLEWFLGEGGNDNKYLREIFSVTPTAASKEALNKEDYNLKRHFAELHALLRYPNPPIPASKAMDQIYGFTEEIWLTLRRIEEAPIVNSGFKQWIQLQIITPVNSYLEDIERAAGAAKR